MLLFRKKAGLVRGEVSRTTVKFFDNTASIEHPSGGMWRRQCKRKSGAFTGTAGHLDGLFHHPGTKAAGAHTNTFGGPIDQRANGLQIRSKDTVGLIVGMADVMPRLMPLVTNLTYVRHSLDSFSRRFVVLKTSDMLPCPSLV